MDNEELRSLVERTAEEVITDYYLTFSDILERLGLLSQMGSDAVVPQEVVLPPEIWIGIAQAVADASGYRVILQADIMEPVKDAPNIYQTVGHRDVDVAEPVWFVKRA